MELKRTRIFLFVLLLATGLVLFNKWQQEQPIVVKPTKTQVSSSDNDIPVVLNDTASAPIANTQSIPSPELIEVITDVLKVSIDPVGGDIVRAELVKFPEDISKPEKGVLLLDKSAELHYIAQTGLTGNDEKGPDSKNIGRAHYASHQKHYRLETDEQLDVNLQWQNEEGIAVTKTLTFNKNSYRVKINYAIQNDSNNPWFGRFYGQIQRDFVKEKSSGMLGVQMYQGGALYTKEKPFKKISYQDMKKAPYRHQEKGGWAAQVEHYFLCAFIPDASSSNSFYTRVDGENRYNIGAVTPVEVLPQSIQNIKAELFIGPEIADMLKPISPGLNLTIDYGILWPISQLIFWLLKTIHQTVQNWGWSIILVTLIIKLIFYKLSASSYRSMGKMRQLQPKMELLKERYKDDKQQFSAAIIDLYKKEKMNPLGGCLPILIQIPVFIALYYVLLESVELRHAPFIFWIQDLSSKDQFYVLPLIMGVTMFLQQKMNPAPPDPVQVKVMMMMPIVFTVLFLSFPSGLVLYWTVNNLLSIAQQWFITRNLERQGTAPKKLK